MKEKVSLDFGKLGSQLPEFSLGPSLLTAVAWSAVQRQAAGGGGTSEERGDEERKGCPLNARDSCSL